MGLHGKIPGMDKNPHAPPAWLEAARAHWGWRGQSRPPFAAETAPGQVSVWDFPRPPRIVLDTREVIVYWGDLLVAQTRRAQLVLETSHPPGFYIPWADITDSALLQAAVGAKSFCEWKGPASYWSLVHPGKKTLANVAWSYPHPLPGAEALADCIAFYPAHLHCTVDGNVVTPQAGGFYGGWITPELTGPFKGEPGTQGW